MDSLRIGKGSSGQGKQSGSGADSVTTSSIPLAIRFHAGDDSVEEVLAVAAGTSAEQGTDAGRTSLSSSPQMGSDDFSWRKDFLQNSFFNRKRSGSVEGANGAGGGTSPGSSLISNLSSSGADPNTLGTWKLIKGKVSQAMEDIKSKNIQSNPTAILSTSLPPQRVESTADGGATESDPETGTSDDISLDLSMGSTNPTPSSVQSKPSKLTPISNDSDFDVDDVDILELESTSQAKSFGSLRSKAVPIATKTSTTPTKKAATQTTTESVGSSSRLFRRRKKDKIDDAVAPVATKPKKDAVEIESGVEMLEDMILPPTSAASLKSKESGDPETSTIDGRDKSGRNSPILRDYYDASSVPNDSSAFVLRKSGLNEYRAEPVATSIQTTTADRRPGHDDNECTSFGQLLIHCLATAYKSRSFIATVALLAILLALPLADFFRGIFACLFTISLFSSVCEIVKILIDKRDIVMRLMGMGANGPEKAPFRIPDYSKLPICEIPAAEEHKPLKSYAGWMNEINNYEPNNFHISMTRPVYVRLDGSQLKISNTNQRIPKRSMWNEPAIHRKNVTFTRHRSFNLLGCRVEMCPRGLARKRYFSRKYPIQLIINTTEPSSLEEKKFRKPIGGSSSLTDLSKVTTHHGNNNDPATISHQNSNESNDDQSDKVQHNTDFDFATIILGSNLQKLHESQHQNQPASESGSGLKDTTNVPCGDETRLLLFARCDREKEDWYRRFLAASVGEINDQELQNPDIVMMTDDEISAAIKAVPSPQQVAMAAQVTGNDHAEETLGATNATNGDATHEDTAKRNSKTSIAEEETTGSNGTTATTPFEGLIIALNAARNSYDYVRFMSLYQMSCINSPRKIPVIKSSRQLKQQNRRQKKHDELWKGIDQNLFLGPSGSVVWANVLMGRVLYSCLNDQALLEKIQDFLQKKLSAIKLPSFMEDVVIAQTCLGDTPPLIHRVSQPMLDERGVWIDADITYEGHMHMTITTKLNLLRLKRQQQQQQHQQHNNNPSYEYSIGGESSVGGMGSDDRTQSSEVGAATDTGSTAAVTPTGGAGGSTTTTAGLTQNSAIYDSDAESTGASSSDSESPIAATADSSVDPSVPSASSGGGGGGAAAAASSSQTFYNTPGNSRRLLRIVDRITASNLFQSATEISYIQRAMENMSTKITLRVELKGLVARIVVNLPPPPSDRIWIAFRGPPRLWISAKPAVGDHTFDWSIVTNVIESKLCDEVYKYLVYPNMVDIIAPFLGQSTYKE